MRNIKSPAQSLCKDVKIEIPKGFGSRPSEGSKTAATPKTPIKNELDKKY